MTKLEELLRAHEEDLEQAQQIVGYLDDAASSNAKGMAAQGRDLEQLRKTQRLLFILARDANVVACKMYTQITVAEQEIKLKELEKKK